MKPIDWFEPVEFTDGTPIVRVDITGGGHPGLVKVWPEYRPAGYPTEKMYGDPVEEGMKVRLDGFPQLKDWDDAVPMVVQKEIMPEGWGQF